MASTRASVRASRSRNAAVPVQAARSAALAARISERVRSQRCRHRTQCRVAFGVRCPRQNMRGGARGGGGTLQMLGGFGFDMHRRRSSNVSLPLRGGQSSKTKWTDDCGNPRSQQHQVVAMDDLVAPAPAQDRLDLVGPMTGDAFGIGAGIGRQAACQRRPVQTRAPRPDHRARTRLRRCARPPAAATDRRRERVPHRCPPPRCREEPARRRSSVCVRNGPLARRGTRYSARHSRARRADDRRGLGDRHRTSRLGGDTRRNQLGAHAARRVTGRGSPPIASISAVTAATTGICAAAGSRRGSAV